jgi:hypothetical protein
VAAVALAAAAIEAKMETEKQFLTPDSVLHQTEGQNNSSSFFKDNEGSPLFLFEVDTPNTSRRFKVNERHPPWSAHSSSSRSAYSTPLVASRSMKRRNGFLHPILCHKQRAKPSLVLRVRSKVRLSDLCREQMSGAFMSAR